MSTATPAERAGQAGEGVARGTCFVAVDIERANNLDHSICQIGIARVERGAVQSVFSTYVDPHQTFGYHHTRLHGIDAKTVRSAPSFASIARRVRTMIESTVAVSHTRADLSALDAALKRVGEPALKGRWVDSVQVVRRAWPERYAGGGWGLAAVAGDLGIDFTHHDAGEDARVCAEIVLAAIRDSGVGLAELGHVTTPGRRPRRKARRGRRARKGAEIAARVAEPKGLGPEALEAARQRLAGEVKAKPPEALARLARHPAQATPRQIARLRLAGRARDAELIALADALGQIEGREREQLGALSIAEASALERLARRLGEHTEEGTK